MKTKEKIDFLIEKMGLTDLDLKDAGERKIFKSSNTRYKLHFTSHEGEKRWLAFASNWEKESALFFALQNKAAKMFGSMPCATTEVLSAFMRTVTGTCRKCGGYGIIPTFDLPYKIGVVTKSKKISNP